MERETAKLAVDAASAFAEFGLFVREGWTELATELLAAGTDNEPIVDLGESGPSVVRLDAFRRT